MCAWRKWRIDTTYTCEAYREILEKIQADPAYQTNIDFGKKRSGHPEGTVRAHIAELERNLERIRSRVSESEYWKLKILIHVHDTFKKEALRGVPISHPQSHASLAAAFLSRYCSDAEMIAIVQYHDEPYALWQKTRNGGPVDGARFHVLLRNIHDWNLFLAFCLVDGCTAGKERDTLQWLLPAVQGRVQTRFTVQDTF